MGATNAVAVAPDWLLTVAVLLGTSIAAFVSYRKGGDKGVPAGEAHTQVVAATFVERDQMERLIVGVVALNGTLAQANDCTDELIGLLKADAHRREVAAEVEQALRNRGVIER